MGLKNLKRHYPKEWSEFLLKSDIEDICYPRDKKVFKTTKHPVINKISQKYSDILQRLHNKNHKLYEFYGGRGLELTFTRREFGEWFLREYKKYYLVYGSLAVSIGRIDYDKGYELDNIEMVSISENTKELYTRRGNPSKRGTVIDSEEKILTVHTFKDRKLLAAHYGISYQAIRLIQVGQNYKKVYEAINE